MGGDAGGRITAVEQLKKDRRRYQIYVDDELACSVHEDILIKYRLLKGEVLEPGFLQLVAEEEERRAAYADALRFLGRRPRSKQEVQKRLLERGYAGPIVQDILARLESDRYLDDESFSKEWAEHRLSAQRKGSRLIRQELLQKGIDKTLVKRTLDEVDANREVQAAVLAARNKWSRSYGSAVEQRHKTAMFLMRRGFSGSVVSKALQLLAAEAEGGCAANPELESDWDASDDSW